MGSDSKLVHVKVYISGTFPARVQPVWDVVRNYGQAETWLTGPQGVKTFTRLLPGQTNCQIGSVRLVTIGQASFVDQLDALDDDRHVMKYKLISHPLNTNPFPGAFLNYRAIIKLYEITRGASTFMEWTGEFDTEPQDCGIMRQAILDRLEAGFQGLELLFPPNRPLQPTNSARGLPNQRMTSQDMAELTRGMNSVQLRAAASVTGSVNAANRSPRAGPGSVAAEQSVPQRTRGITESGSSGSLASSPHFHDSAAQRPSSGHILNQWTSGGSGSTIHLSTLPMRLSGEDAQLTGDAKRSSARHRGQKETSADNSTVPQAFLAQVKERQAAQQQPQMSDAFQKYQYDVSRPQEMPRQRPTAPIPAPASNAFQPAYQQANQHGFPQGYPNPFQHGIPSHSHLPQQQKAVDPLLQDREDFKASIIAQRFQHLLPKHAPESLPSVPGPTSRSEPDWSRVPHKDEDRSAGSSLIMTPFASTGIPGTDDDPEWARLMQQREDDLREAHARRSRSPVQIKAATYGPSGPFGAASTVSSPAAANPGASGPFGAASLAPAPTSAAYAVAPAGTAMPAVSPYAGGPFAAAASTLPSIRGVHRSISHSVSSMSHEASGMMDRSAESTLSHPDEGLPSRGGKRVTPESASWSSQ